MSGTNPTSGAGNAGIPPVQTVPGGTGRSVAWLQWLGPLAVLACGALLWAVEPRGQVYFPRCALYAATGLQCPGCGGLRATHALLNGDWSAAWKLNALYVCYLPILSWVGLAFVARRFGRRLPNPFAAPWMIGTLFGFAMVFGVLRNLPMFAR